MAHHLKGSLLYTDTDGAVYTLNPCELHGTQPKIKIGKSAQWGRQVLVQCPDCAGMYIPRHGSEDNGNAVKLAVQDWNNDNPTA